MVKRFETKPTETMNATRGQSRRLPCQKCAATTLHYVEVSHDIDATVYDRYEDVTYHTSDNYQVVRCGGCNSHSFRHLAFWSEDHDPYDELDGATENLYPARSADDHPLRTWQSVPDNIQAIYREVVKALSNGLYLLCAAGLRAIVEGICVDQGITGGKVLDPSKNPPAEKTERNLRGKIAGLHQRGFLTQDQSNSLHHHRFMGNSAVHQLRAPPRSELRLALQIVEHVLDQVYEFPEKADRLSKARKLSNP